MREQSEAFLAGPCSDYQRLTDRLRVHPGERPDAPRPTTRLDLPPAHPVTGADDRFLNSNESARLSALACHSNTQGDKAMTLKVVNGGDPDAKLIELARRAIALRRVYDEANKTA